MHPSGHPTEQAQPSGHATEQAQSSGHATEQAESSGHATEQAQLQRDDIIDKECEDLVFEKNQSGVTGIARRQGT